jgi:hypothetical protein
MAREYGMNRFLHHPRSLYDAALDVQLGTKPVYVSPLQSQHSDTRNPEQTDTRAIVRKGIVRVE